MMDDREHASVRSSMMAVGSAIPRWLSLMLCVTTVSCGHRARMPIPRFVWHDPHVTHVLRNGGTQCEFDDVRVAEGPPSYPIDAIGKPGSPAVTAGDRSLVREIRRYAPRLRLLRYTYLSGSFVVFDASGGPCSPQPERVLTQGCNAFYRPGEAADAIVSAPSCLGRPRPWIMNDGGEPTAPAWATIRDDDGPQFISG